MKMCPESPYTHHLYIMQSAFKFTNTWNFWLHGSTIRKQDIKTIFPKPAAKKPQQIFRKLKKKSCKNRSKWDVKVLMLTTGSFSQIGQEFMFPSSFSLHYTSSLLVGPHRTSDYWSVSSIPHCKQDKPDAGPSSVWLTVQQSTNCATSKHWQEMLSSITQYIELLLQLKFPVSMRF